MYVTNMISCRHVVTGWAITRNAHTKEMVYEISFKRLANEPSMDTVLRRPFSDEVEDYKEYKRLRQTLRAEQEEAANATKGVITPTFTISIDGTAEDSAYEAAEMSS